MNRVLFSSINPVYSTPDWLFESLKNEFQFTIDAAADPENAKCDKYFTASDDGLLQHWDGVVWCNPPYGRQISLWVHKAFLETGNGVTTVLLLPARTDTKWFHDFVLNNAEIRFIKGRLKFGGEKYNAPFPSMLVIFKPK